MQKAPKQQINELTRKIAQARENKRNAKYSVIYGNTIKKRKLACGWTPGWLPGSLVAPKNPAQGCAATNFVSGGTRKRKIIRQSYTKKTHN
jgi:hypothetical protein